MPATDRWRAIVPSPVPVFTAIAYWAPLLPPTGVTLAMFAPVNPSVMRLKSPASTPVTGAENVRR